MTFSSQIEKEAGPQAGLFAGVQLEPLRVEDPGESSKAGSAALGRVFILGAVVLPILGRRVFLVLRGVVAFVFRTLFVFVLVHLISPHCCKYATISKGLYQLEKFFQKGYTSGAKHGILKQNLPYQALRKDEFYEMPLLCPPGKQGSGLPPCR